MMYTLMTEFDCKHIDLNTMQYVLSDIILSSVRSQDKTILPILWGIYVASQIPLLSKLQSHNTEHCKTLAVLVPDSNRHFISRTPIPQQVQLIMPSGDAPMNG